MLSWLLVSLADDVTFLILARILVGISNAFVSTSVYTVEVVSVGLRAPLSMIEPVFRSVGMLAIFVLGYRFRWHQISVFAWILPGLALALAFLVPESPIHLIRMKREKEAQKALDFLYGKREKNQKIIEDTISNLSDLGQKVLIGLVFGKYFFDLKDTSEKQFFTWKRAFETTSLPLPNPKKPLAGIALPSIKFSITRILIIILESQVHLLMLYVHKYFTLFSWILPENCDSSGRDLLLKPYCVYVCQLQGLSTCSRHMAFCFYLIGHEFKILTQNYFRTQYLYAE